MTKISRREAITGIIGATAGVVSSSANVSANSEYEKTKMFRACFYNNKIKQIFLRFC